MRGGIPRIFFIHDTMVAIEFLAVLAVGAVLLFLNAIPRYGYLVSSIFLLVFFSFQAVNLDARQGTFYSAMALSVLVFAALRIGAGDVQGVSLFGSQFSGPAYSIVVVLVGGLLAAILASMEAGASGRILGVPGTLAAGSSILSPFSAAAVAALGYIENRFIFGLSYVLERFVLPFVPVLQAVPAFIVAAAIASAIFGLFHLVAYQLSISLILFAMAVMFLWLMVSRVVGEEPTSFSHFVHNARIALLRSVAVVAQ